MKNLEQSKYLSRVNSVKELRELTLDELPLYCAELREFIIESVAENPGHLGSSLGALELAVALHYVYDTPNDRVVWDVGHQAYAHKIITGRRDRFNSNRKYGGISGFPKRSESEFDHFGGGHASVSISAAVGIAAASKLKNEERQVIAVIGDGALTGGLAFEGLNSAKEHDMLVILNDNNISIDPNVGALSNYLTKLTMSKNYNRLKERLWRFFGFWPALRNFLRKIGGGAKSFFFKRSNLFEALGFRYFGPVEGNDVKNLVYRLRDLKRIKGAKLLHIITTKGKGYKVAEQDQTKWHAPGKFNPLTGEKEPTSDSLRYQEIFGHTLKQLMDSNEKIVGITPAMPTGCSMNIVIESYPNRAFDVGIAEGHAITFSGGLATEGMMPFCNIYSSFAQRSVDNIVHDIILQSVDVVLCLDRAGLVGEDGATHHGLYDIPMLRSIPNVIISAPSSAEELRNLMFTASKGGYGGCFVIRYPRGGNFNNEVLLKSLEVVEIGKGRVLREGQGIALVSLGATLEITAEAAERLDATHIDMRFVKPLDQELLRSLAANHNRVVVVEDGAVMGGAGSAIREFFSENMIDIKVLNVGIEDRIIEQGTLSELYCEVGLTTENIVRVANLGNKSII